MASSSKSLDSPNPEKQNSTDSKNHNSGADGWIFAPDTSTLSTEKLPDSSDFERIRLNQANLDQEPARIFPEVPKTEKSPAEMLGSSKVPGSKIPGSTQAQDNTPAPGTSKESNGTSDQATSAGAEFSDTPLIFKHGVGLTQPSSLETEILPGAEEINSLAQQSTEKEAAAPALPASGKNPITPATPTQPPKTSLRLMEKYPGLHLGDLLRDFLAIAALLAAPFTTFLQNFNFIAQHWAILAAALGILGILIANALRWVPKFYAKVAAAKNPVMIFQTIRRITLLPVLAFATAVILADLVAAIPMLLAPGSKEPLLGLGTGVALMVLGALLGLEARSSEGHQITEKKKLRAAILLNVFRGLLLASFVLALVMLVGRVISGDWLFSVVTLSKAIGALALGLLIINYRLRTHHTWYIFLVAASSLLVIGALFDNSLRLNFAAPGSFSNSYIWLPIFMAAYAVLISRTYVRTISFKYSRADWIHYTALALEFSTIMHLVAAVSSSIFAIAIFAGYESNIGPKMAVFNVIMLLILAALSNLGRGYLNQKAGIKARNHTVAIAVALLVLGFIGIVIFSLLTGAAAGLTNGGLAFLTGLAALLMLTMPVPDRDEYGVPDLDATFAKFRSQTRPYFGKAGREQRKVWAAKHGKDVKASTQDSQLENSEPLTTANSETQLPRHSAVLSAERGLGLGFLEKLAASDKQAKEPAQADLAEAASEQSKE